MAAQEACGQGIRTRIRSGALPPTAGRLAQVSAESAMEPAVVQLSSAKAGTLRARGASHRNRASTAASLSALEDATGASSAAQVDTSAARAAGGRRGKPSATEASSGKASKQGMSAAAALRSAEAGMSRLRRLLKSGHFAAKAGVKQAHAAAATAGGHSSPLKQPDSTDAAEPSAAETAPRPNTLARSLPAQAVAQAAAAAALKSAEGEPARCDAAASAAAGVESGAGVRGRKRPSPKKAPGSGLRFRARRAPKELAFTVDALDTTSKSGKPT